MTFILLMTIGANCVIWKRHRHSEFAYFKHAMTTYMNVIYSTPYMYVER